MIESFWNVDRDQSELGERIEKGLCEVERLVVFVDVVNVKETLFSSVETEVGLSISDFPPPVSGY